ncbi:DUF2946 family protein [Rhodoferax sp. PAMC 29310]|uniref:DUF2946 family protein n=1 Tax=Rhodoferax sp. PAMC 29310 TaxID=2822760 RepID=UPI001B33EB24|nr:DUF2946 family protein [Rhodoferax sp. PAMC 29310]
MDDIVKQALLKWPNVPACYGWLGLDARGNWFMRDDQAQAQGPFAGGTQASKGSQLKHEKLIDFIARNYDADDKGQWFFQNGPQRVYVELEATPLIWRVGNNFAVEDHLGRSATVKRCLVDEVGCVYFETDIGFGLVHTADMNDLANAVEQGVWSPELVSRDSFEAQYGFRKSPEVLQKQ